MVTELHPGYNIFQALKFFLLPVQLFFQEEDLYCGIFKLLFVIHLKVLQARPMTAKPKVTTIPQSCFLMVSTSSRGQEA